MQQLPKFLVEKGLTPNVEINPDLNFLGTETAFSFGARVLDVERSGKFPQVYKFHIGDTGPKTPEPIIKVAIQALKDKQTKYAPFLGYSHVRENIARYWTKTRGVKIKKENVMLQPGGKPVIELTLQTLVKPGDQVIGQNPGFPIYESLAQFYSRGNYIPWIAHRDPETQALDFQVEDLAKLLAENKKVKLLIINTPQNPTGMMLSWEKLEAIAKLVKKYQFMVLFDDIYDQIVFSGREHVSFLSLPGMKDYTINLNGYSKNYAMTGWRIGVIVAPEWLIEIFGRLAINKWSCVNRVSQIVAGVIYGDVEVDGYKYPSVASKIKPIITADIKEYEKKGRFLVEALRLLAPYIIPNEAEGAFYIFPNIEEVLKLPYVKNKLGLKTDKGLSEWLLAEKGFAALGGSDFGIGGKNYLRLSYAEDREKQIIPGVKHLLKVIIELITKSYKSPPLSLAEIDQKVGEIAKKYFG